MLALVLNELLVPLLQRQFMHAKSIAVVDDDVNISDWKDAKAVGPACN